jgi:ATP-dependent RNA helicase RhlE
MPHRQNPNQPKPFSEFHLDERLLKAVAELGYERPTPIQEQAIPLVMAGKDIIGSAQTGTGKTAAFGLPILQRLLDENKKTHIIRALILAPTRELTVQIDEAIKSYARHTKIRIAAVYGGVATPPQTRALREGVDIVVATPGRLLDHLDQRNLNFRDLDTFVLDEADRMLDMGFLPDIRRILHYLPNKRQTMLFSATIPSEIAVLANSMLHNPEHVKIGRVSAAAVGITHAVYPVAAHLKAELLPAILREARVQSALVFTRTKRRADRLARVLIREGLKIDVIHGDRTQKQRIAALEGFRRGKYQVLVATDIAARGLDVEGITHVVNFDVPGTPEDYVHRIGRTARADALGDAFTLMSPEEEYQMRDIEKHLGHALPRIALRDFNYYVPAPERATGLQRPSVNTITTMKSFRASRKSKIPRKR